MLDITVPKVPQVEAKTVYDASLSSEDFILLDVRTPQEYTKNKIGKSINLPLNEIEQKVLTVIPDLNKKIYVYCLSGSRSLYAVDQMIKLGYKNVFDVKNGLLGWRVNNFPVIQS